MPCNPLVGTHSEPRKYAMKTRGRPFQAGNSGKPRGVRHRATQMIERILTEGAENVAQAAVTAAQNGDMTAARLVLDRVCPLRKGRPIMLSITAIDTPAEISAALSTITLAMCRAEISPEEAAVIAGVIKAKCELVSVVELEARIRELEGKA
jgi:hypothetical protein